MAYFKSIYNHVPMAYMNGLISYLPESEVAVARLDLFSPGHLGISFIK